MKRLPPLQAGLLRTVGDWFAPGGARGALVVLIYHRVLAEPDPILSGEPTADEFAAQMDTVAATCRVLPLSEAIARLRAGSLPPRAVSITFDDGYANNRELAAPILKARGIPATIFVATGFIGRGRMWNDTVIEAVRGAGARLDLGALGVGLGVFELADAASRIRALDKILPALKYLDPAQRQERAQAVAAAAGIAHDASPMMSEQQIRELEAFGIEIGAHTVTHPILRSIDADAARKEIAASKDALESITKRQISLFAYPNGRPGRDYDASHVALVKRCGFDAAVSTAWGAAGRSVDTFQIPRMLPWDSSPLKFAARLLRTYREQRPEQLGLV
jgi:peptidoglycan/xylan/chitin deacetylase (PgdA/CDA1 family)